MIAALRSEVLKLLTVRSTYFISILAVALAIFLGFYAIGFHSSPISAMSPTFLRENVSGVFAGLSILGTIVGILSVTHEYRHNTIAYTLTSSNSRFKVLAAKVAVVSAFILIYTLALVFLLILMIQLGLQAKGVELAPQTFQYSDFLWKTLAYAVGYGMLGMLLATIIRNQIGAVVTLFVAPTLESFLAIWLKEDAFYLPFASSSVLMRHDLGPDVISAGTAAIILGVYVVAGWVVAGFLFWKRDAN